VKIQGIEDVQHKLPHAPPARSLHRPLSERANEQATGQGFVDEEQEGAAVTVTMK
jgi:hypothetical protein